MLLTPDGPCSTIVTSQLDPSHWHDYLADPTLADAICDRLLSHAHRIVLKGPSRRKEKETPRDLNRTSVASLRPRWRETLGHHGAERPATIGEMRTHRRAGRKAGAVRPGLQ